MNEKRRLYLLTGALLLTIILRIECIFMPVIDHLESVYSTTVSMVMAGDRLYTDMSAMKLPFAYLPIHIVYLIFGRNNLLALHIFSIFWAVMIMLVVFKMATYAYGWKIGIISAYLFAIFSATLNVSGGGGLPMSLTFMSFESEFTSCLPLSMACFMFLKSIREKKKIHLFLTGFFWALSLSVNPKNGILVFIMTGYLAILLFYPNQIINWKSATKYLLYIAFSTLIGCLPVVVYLFSIKSLNGLTSFYLDLKHFVEGIDIFSFFTFKRFILTIFYICIKNNYLLWFSTAVAIIIVAFNILRNLIKYHKLFLESGNQNLLANIIFILWFFSAFLAIFADAPKFWRQHYGHLFPSLMVLSSYGIYAIWNKAKKIGRTTIKLGILIFIIIGVFYPIYTNQIKRIKSIKRVRGYLNYPIFEYIKKNTEINDRIYTWCYFVDIYTLSNRVSATPYLGNIILVGLKWTIPFTFGEVEPRIIENFLEAMEKNKPKIIIDPSGAKKEPHELFGGFLWPVILGRFPPIQEIPFLWKFVQENYYFREDIDGIAIYWRKSGNNGKAYR